MLSMYPACFYRDKEGYSVVFPDLNWLSTCGDTLDEAMKMAVDCLAGYLYTIQKEGNTFPSPSELSQINIAAIAQELDINSPANDSFVNIITVDVDEYANNTLKSLLKKRLPFRHG